MSPLSDLPSFPFNRIAVAVAFSPRIEAILAESRRLKHIFKSEMIFIHVGKKNLQEEQYLKHLLHRFELSDSLNNVYWETGDPVEMILKVCAEQRVDLLVAGALEKESLLKYFMGSVARSLCRKAKCSILMLREPSILSKPVRSIVVEGSDDPKTANTIQTAIYVAKQAGAEKIRVIQESDERKLALARSIELSENEQVEIREKIEGHEAEKMEEIIRCTDCGNIDLNTERLEGKPGFVISKYARESGADLLMLNSPSTKLGLLDRVFPHDIEFALADLPCDLMIVHPKHEEPN